MKIENYTNTTISSLEIAEITGKRHDNIIRDIETQLIKVLGEGGLLKFEETYIQPQNKQSYKFYNLPKIEALIVVSGYDAKLRASIIYRLDELERKNLQSLTNKTATQTISYDDYLKAISEAHEAKLELSNAKHQITKEKLSNARKELKTRKKEIADLKSELRDI